MAKAEHTAKILRNLVALQDCLDSQYCRSLSRQEQEGQSEEAGGPKCRINIPDKSPLRALSPEHAGVKKGSLDCNEVCDALKTLDEKILGIAAAAKK